MWGTSTALATCVAITGPLSLNWTAGTSIQSNIALGASIHFSVLTCSDAQVSLSPSVKFLNRVLTIEGRNSIMHKILHRRPGPNSQTRVSLSHKSSREQSWRDDVTLPCLIPSSVPRSTCRMMHPLRHQVMRISSKSMWCSTNMIGHSHVNYYSSTFKRWCRGSFDTPIALAVIPELWQLEITFPIYDASHIYSQTRSLAGRCYRCHVPSPTLDGDSVKDSTSIFA